MFQRLSMQRVLSAVAIAGCLVTGLQTTSIAQGLPGLTIFSGVARENELGYRLDFGGNPGAWDRYRLRIPAKKMKVAVAQFTISYPDHFNGSFNTKQIELIVRGKSVKLQEVKWDQDQRRLEIFPSEPVPSNTGVEVQLSDVRNPTNPGMFYFNCLVESPGDVPVLRELGTWIIKID